MSHLDAVKQEGKEEQQKLDENIKSVKASIKNSTVEFQDLTTDANSSSKNLNQNTSPNAAANPSGSVEI